MSTKKPRRVHVAIIKNKNAKQPTYLLRHTYREDGKVKHLTLGNISDLPLDLIELIRQRLASDQPLEIGAQGVQVARSLPHGHVAAVLGTARRIKLDQLLASRPCRERDLVLAMIVDRIISPGSKLSCAGGLATGTAQTTLAQELGLGDVDVHELYDALDWLLARQKRIENKLAKKHLTGGTLLMFDVSSSFYTGRKSTLIRHGYSRDHRGDCPQIVYGLLCDAHGRPIAIEVFPGNTADPKAFTHIVSEVRRRFGIDRIIYVGDRGMITSARIREDLSEVEGLDWISALRTEGIRKLVSSGLVNRSLFDEKDLAEIRDEENFPGERLVVCRNPLLAEERERKRNELLAATEKELEKIVAATVRPGKNRLQGKDQIGLKVGRVINKYKMSKHFELTITDDSFTYSRKADQITAEAALDGLYVVRTSVPETVLPAEGVVSAYKSLAKVERAFRSLKSVDLHIRPIYHHKDDRIRAHVFLCMLAYYLEWHLRESLADVLYDDTDRESAQSARSSVVSPSVRSESAKAKDATGRNAQGDVVQSFQDVLKDLGTLCRNSLRLTGHTSEWTQLTEATASQSRALELLGITP